MLHLLCVHTLLWQTSNDSTKLRGLGEIIVAQLVEYGAHDHERKGSNPTVLSTGSIQELVLISRS